MITTPRISTHSLLLLSAALDKFVAGRKQETALTERVSALENVGLKLAPADLTMKGS